MFAFNQPDVKGVDFRIITDFHRSLLISFRAMIVQFSFTGAELFDSLLKHFDFRCE
jgi:hypothetical protein